MKKVVLGAMLCGGLWGYDSIDEALEMESLVAILPCMGAIQMAQKIKVAIKAKMTLVNLAIWWGVWA